jgi:hypothetical protein
MNLQWLAPEAPTCSRNSYARNGAPRYCPNCQNFQ